MNQLRKSLRTLLRLLWHPLCRHTETLTKTAGTRAYTECLRCEYQSKGVVIAGHDYASTKHSWEPAPLTRSLPPYLPPAAIAPEHMIKIRDGVYSSESVPRRVDDARIRQIMENVFKPLPPVALAPESAQSSRAEVAAIFGVPILIETPPVLGNLAGHATAVRRKPVAKPARKPRKISVKSVRKTSRKPSSKRSKTA